jgi:SAM-dependent methyltransferase
MDRTKLFDAAAMPDRDWWTALWPDPADVLRRVGVRRGLRGVDLCCGDGHFTVPMARLTEAEVVAVDLDPHMLAAGRHAAAADGVSNVRFLEADAMQLASAVEPGVDFVLIANTFHGAPDKTGLARVVHDVLRPGGTFVVVNWWPRPREETTVLGTPRGPRAQMRFSPTEVAAWVTPAGFALREVVDVGPYHYGAIFEAQS